MKCNSFVAPCHIVPIHHFGRNLFLNTLKHILLNLFRKVNQLRIIHIFFEHHMNQVVLVNLVSICVWKQIEKIIVFPKYIHEDVIALSECDPIKIPEPWQSRGMSECLTHISHLVMDSLLLTIMSHGDCPLERLVNKKVTLMTIWIYVAQVYYKDRGLEVITDKVE